MGTLLLDIPALKNILVSNNTFVAIPQYIHSLLPLNDSEKFFFHVFSYITNGILQV